MKSFHYFTVLCDYPFLTFSDHVHTIRESYIVLTCVITILLLIIVIIIIIIIIITIIIIIMERNCSVVSMGK